MTEKLSQILRRIDRTIEKQHFAGMDQNPHGVRDLIGSAVFRAEKMERALSCITHDNGAPKFSHDGTLLDAGGNRSVFDDIDEGGAP